MRAKTLSFITGMSLSWSQKQLTSIKKQTKQRYLTKAVVLDYLYNQKIA